MKKEDEFYVGYLPTPPSTRKKLIRIVITLGIVLIVSGILLAVKQRGFSNGTFEFGKETSLNGVLTKDPIPMLLIDKGKDASGQHRFESIVLVGYGKHGAEDFLLQKEKEIGISLQNKTVNLKGSLIYHDGKAILELTNKVKASIEPVSSVADIRIPNSISPAIAVKLHGEIIDPKCYFGVMKPGEGKPHRDCAIRCISGGIPPMFKVTNALGENNYFILKSKNSSSINKRVLPFVADQVVIDGSVNQYNDWMVLTVDRITRTSN